MRESKSQQENLKFAKAQAALGFMTCYFIYLDKVFKKAGIEVAPQNRQKIDRIIHDVVNEDYKNCSELGDRSRIAWRKTRLLLASICRRYRMRE
jgi:hypothetical protein